MRIVFSSRTSVDLEDIAEQRLRETKSLVSGRFVPLQKSRRPEDAINPDRMRLRFKDGVQMSSAAPSSFSFHRAASVWVHGGRV